MTDASLRAPAFAERDFRVGRVFSRSWAVFSRNIVKFFVLTLIAFLAAGLAVFVIVASTVGSGIALALVTQQLTPAILRGLLVAVALAAFLVSVLLMIGQAPILYGAFQDMRGRTAGLGESLKKGWVRFFPIVGLAICWSLTLLVGFVLLIVPAFIFLTMFFVALPACVVEKLGPIRSMGRSAALTKGHRWKVFGIIIIIFIASNVIEYALQKLLIAVAGQTAGLIGSVLWNALWTVFYAIVVAVIYYDLRVAKEGIDIEQIAAVFD